MRRLSIIAALTITALTGCYIDLNNDYIAPYNPTNVNSVTGDDEVTIQWDPVYVGDLDGYYVYRSQSNSFYSSVRIGFTNLTYYVDYTARNGLTYFYWVTAIDIYGNESSVGNNNYAYDTPRPEGYSVRMWDYYEFEDQDRRYSGYDFSEYRLLPSADPYCDFYLEYRDGRFWLFVGTALLDDPYNSETWIYDYGYSTNRDIKDVDYAPRGTDSQWEDDRLEALANHLYVIMTWDHHFAAIWIKEKTSEYIVFDWSYQLDSENPELAPIMTGKLHKDLPVNLATTRR
jgi:hypothetical protein